MKHNTLKLTAVIAVLVLTLTTFVGCKDTGKEQKAEPGSASQTATATAAVPTGTSAESQPTATTTDATVKPTSATTTFSENGTTKKAEPGSALTTKQEAQPTKAPAKPAVATTKKPAPKTTKAPAKTTKPVHYATASDTEAVANALIKYINQFRAQDGQAAATKVGGKLKQLADQRSVSISKNFCHDLKDEQRICTAIKFGEVWVKDAENCWWCKKDIDETFVPATDGEWHYEPGCSSYDCCTEAIGSDGPYYGNKTPDELGKELATGCRNSAGHWRYVGDGVTYPYISVGMTYSNGTWYAAVWVGNSHLPEYN